MAAQWSMIIAGILMLALGLFFLWRIVSLKRRKTASQSWPVVNARVTGRDVSLQRSQRGSSYIPHIDYTYSVMNAELQKHKSLGSKATRDGAEKVLGAVGETFEVRYNPEKPDQHVSILDKVGPGDIVLVVALFILAAVMFVLAFAA